MYYIYRQCRTMLDSNWHYALFGSYFKSLFVIAILSFRLLAHVACSVCRIMCVCVCARLHDVCGMYVCAVYVCGVCCVYACVWRVWYVRVVLVCVCSVCGACVAPWPTQQAMRCVPEVWPTHRVLLPTPQSKITVVTWAADCTPLKTLNGRWNPVHQLRSR